MIERHSLFGRKEVIPLKTGKDLEKQKIKYCYNLETCQSNKIIQKMFNWTAQYMEY